MKKSIRIVARGFWQGAKKLERTSSIMSELNSGNYMNGCVIAARENTVMVSPFISPHSYDAGKRRITRNECVMLNNLAEEIADEENQSIF